MTPVMWEVQIQKPDGRIILEHYRNGGNQGGRYGSKGPEDHATADVPSAGRFYYSVFDGSDSNQRRAEAISVHYSDGAKSLTAIVIAIDARAAVEQLKRAHKVDRVIQTKQLYSEEEMQKETIQNQEEDNDMTEENTNLREEIAEAMSGENISDETRGKAITLFEKAVYLKVTKSVRCWRESRTWSIAI
jgi:hypothetical protein